MKKLAYGYFFINTGKKLLCAPTQPIIDPKIKYFTCSLLEPVEFLYWIKSNIKEYVSKIQYKLI